jgi:hypothetical protein
VEKDFVSIMNVWGLDVKHVAFCLVVPRKHASWLPCDPAVQLQHNPKSLKEMYYPQPFVATGGKRALDNRLGVAFNYTARSSNSPTETVRGREVSGWVWGGSIASLNGVSVMQLLKQKLSLRGSRERRTCCMGHTRVDITLA